jgi:hypothetical protein
MSVDKSNQSCNIGVESGMNGMKGNYRKINILIDLAAMLVLIAAFILNGCSVAR